MASATNLRNEAIAVIRARCASPGRPPWPAYGRGHAMRARFFRRFAAIALVVLICAAVGFATLVSLVLSRVGVGAAPPTAVLFTIAAAVDVPILLMVAVVQRVGAPLGVVMEAADRVADGN